MKSRLSAVLLASTLSLTAIAAIADTAPWAGHSDTARAEKMYTHHITELKTKLHITPDQESAWKTFAEALKPQPHDGKQRPDWKSLAQLSTPERIDQLHTLRLQHQTEENTMHDQHDAAIKTFYAVLTPEQKKTFDSVHMQHHHDWHHEGTHDAPPAGLNQASPKAP